MNNWTAEDEIDKYWPARHLIKYYEGVIKGCEERIARAKQKIEEARKSCEKSKPNGANSAGPCARSDALPAAGMRGPG